MPIAASVHPGVLQAISDEAVKQGTPWLLLGYLVTALLLRTVPDGAELRARMRALTVLLGLHVILLPAIGACVALDSAATRDLRLTGSILGAIAGVGLIGVVIFGVITPRMRMQPPRILQDVLVGAVSILVVFSTATRAGINLSGIVATGAVLTAVIGLALQDTLGNVMGGLSVQMDATVRVGDWIRVAEVVGRVTEIRWRSTSIETRDWETVIIPNSVLTKTQVIVLGRRMGQEPRLRRTIFFNVDFRFAPAQVMELAAKAVSAQPIENVALNPPPYCILMEFQESYARYAVRYFMLDFASDNTTDSEVRTRLYYAFMRAGIPLAIPAHALFLTEDSQQRRADKRDADTERRMAALRRIAFFRDLEHGERQELAASLHRAPFARGEVLTRQGAEAHHLYIIDRGRVSVRVREGQHEHEVSQIGAGEFFGEMSLLTGEKRSATVVALTEVECYRLDADAFRRLLERRPDLAETVATKLAERRVELVATRDELADRHSMIEQDQRDLLHKIREFFRL